MRQRESRNLHDNQRVAVKESQFAAVAQFAPLLHEERADLEPVDCTVSARAALGGLASFALHRVKSAQCRDERLALKLPRGRVCDAAHPDTGPRNPLPLTSPTSRRGLSFTEGIILFDETG